MLGNSLSVPSAIALIPMNISATSHTVSAMRRAGALWQHVAFQCNSLAVSGLTGAFASLLDHIPDRCEAAGARCRCCFNNTIDICWSPNKLVLQWQRSHRRIHKDDLGACCTAGVV